jgi:hypothetical protein
VRKLADQNGRNCRRIAAICCALAAIAGAPLVLAPAASAQSVIDQYRPVPGGGGGEGGVLTPGGGGSLAAAEIPGGPLGPAATTAAPGGSEELPFTGYPLTSLLIALLILLLVGIALRIAFEVRERLQGRV